MIEYEMKFRHHHDDIREKLIDMEAQLHGTEKNLDQYFNHPIRNFKETDEALRIRETSSNVFITYKGPKIDDTSKSRQEIEVEIENTELGKILEILDFSYSGKVEKVRENWSLDDVLITLDEVSGLGEFVELEIEADEKEFEKHLDKLKSTASKLGLEITNQIRESYLELLEMGINK